MVEDSASDVLLLQEALRTHGVSVPMRVLRDGELAVQHIERIGAGELVCPALFILDLNLPKRSGAEVLQRLRKSAVCKQCPVMVLSSSEAPQDKFGVEELGIDIYLRKPLRLDEFMNIGLTVKNLLSPSMEQ